MENKTNTEKKSEDLGFTIDNYLFVRGMKYLFLAILLITTLICIFVAIERRQSGLAAIASAVLFHTFYKR